MASTSMIRVNLFLTIPQKSALDALAQDTGLSVAEHARRALDEYLKGLQQAASPKPTSSKRKARTPK
jgi:hypothetical protein